MAVVTAESLVIVRRVRLEILQLFGGSVFRPITDAREPAVVSRLQRLWAANIICRRQNPAKMNFPYGHRISKKDIFMHTNM